MMRALIGLVALISAGCGGTTEAITVTVTTGASRTQSQVTTEQARTETASTKPAPTAQVPINVVFAFQDAGLEAEMPRTMTRDDYGLAPMRARSEERRVGKECR